VNQNPKIQRFFRFAQGRMRLLVIKHDLGARTAHLTDLSCFIDTKKPSHQGRLN